MNKPSIILCPNDSLLNPESIKAFAENNKDNWKLLLIDHHPDLKTKMDNVYQAYIDQESVMDHYQSFAKTTQEVATQYQASQALWVSLNDWLVELEWIVEDEIHDTPEYLYDQMMAFSTLISSLLVMAVIPQVIWLDARDFIKTDDQYGNPKVIENIKWEKLKKGKRYISQAFLGSTSENNSTTVTTVGQEALWLRTL